MFAGGTRAAAPDVGCMQDAGLFSFPELCRAMRQAASFEPMAGLSRQPGARARLRGRRGSSA